MLFAGHLHSARWPDKTSEQAIEHIPDKKTREFANKHQNGSPHRPGLIETESYGYHITDKRDPAKQGQPDSIAVYFFLLPDERLRLYLEPFFNPLPFAYPPYPELSGSTVAARNVPMKSPQSPSPSSTPITCVP